MKLLLYFLKRLAYLVPVLLGLTLIVFLVSHALPGDPTYLFVGQEATEARLAAIREYLGLDQPLWVQYRIWITGVVRGDWGNAWYTSRPVLEDIKEMFPITFELTTVALVVSIIIAIPLGVVAAVRKDSMADGLIRGFSLIGISVPDFWLGLIMIYAFYFLWRVAPPPMGRVDIMMTAPAGPTRLLLIDSLLSGQFDLFRSAVKHLILPVSTLAIINLAPISRQVRSAMVDVLESHHIRAAWAAGVPGRMVYYRLALKNALLPVVTITGVLYGRLLGGAVIIEKIFAWPGLGRYALTAIEVKDYAAVQGFVLLSAMLYVGVFLLVDLVYFWIDPRIKM